MSTVFTDVSAGLDKHLNDMAGKPPIAWPNDAYTPVKDTLYARPINLQGNTFAETENDRTNGVYQIDIFAPSGKGKKEAMDMADVIADRFKQDTEITYNSQTVRIQTCSLTNTGNTSEGFYQIMIEAQYYCFSARRA